jgi:hypothetical protein
MFSTVFTNLPAVIFEFNNTSPGNEIARLRQVDDRDLTLAFAAVAGL